MELSRPDAHTAFVAAMLRPESYAATAAAHELPLVAPSAIRLVETHVSWVFLTGTHAYKVKKPLRLPFLDYSTAARREHFCREELRLNRRHAPGLYLDVVPIAGTPAAPRVGATDAPPFEHALCMRQFDTSQELDRLVGAGDVQEVEIDMLATAIASAHAAADAAASPLGTPEAAHEVTCDNLAELEALLPGAGATLGPLRAATEQAFSRLVGRLRARREAGRVRECHGDLHCGNVVRWEGRLVPFDGLEFDPALRFIDVASDVAFLSMDLAVRGRRDLRRTLLDGWAAASGDYGAIELLPYFELHRALVRAKVAALRSRRPQAPAVAGTVPATDYLGWAASHASRGPPQLVVMTGLSGSGKTWLGTRIARVLDAIVVRSDVERKRLAGLAPLEASHSAPGAGLYTPGFNARTYDRLRECVVACLRGGESVVVDAANLRRAERSAFLQLAADTGADARIVHCVAPRETLRARIELRRAQGTDASEATVELLERQPAYWEPLAPEEQTRMLEVDTAQPAQVAGALARLAQR